MSDNTEETQEQTATESQEPTQPQPSEQQNVPRETSEENAESPEEQLILGKFKSQDALEKGYQELEKFVGGNKDEMREQIINELSEEADNEVPENYELPPLPDHITEDDVMENPMTEWWRGHCAENAYDQEMFQDGINAYIDMMGNYAPNAEQEMSKLGENARARVDAVDSFAQTYFSPDQHEYIQQTLGTTAEGIEILEKVMDMRNENISNYQQTEPINKLTLDDVRGMMKDPRYFDPRERDESFVKKVDDAFARLYR